MALLSRKKTDRDTTLQMAPMIDCVFLLLIFFMVSAVMKNEPDFTVTLPDSETKHEFPRKKYNVFIGQNGQVAIDDQTHDLDSMERWLAANQQRISTLIVKADRYAKHGLVIDVMERAKLQLNKEEGQEIALAVSEDKL
ncbi:TPA: biopolymer transporter ExbD [Candidatus Poribacteria bacterium]|jgi:biopolymer transport protein ExbD|nr:biopolymer transporter ExbD [Candidatus Poribacteria bacterium]HIA64973.1 biopolymer transporter ExbD [Candidatus Poribacteria bacterium]HIB92628.1 biopolymer transporter ExbD [Candidatus Poribacteria bacterium]HIC01609.1 biopolymer transporter ExbD [Candidatus Poribacteria bacterium]HIO07110.1 biopolymer transporter ExbD [Candidatus Poribacteria bacterium]